MVCLHKKDTEKINAHARKEFPLEACGIIAENKQTGEIEVYEMTNAEKSSETYFMDPKEQLHVMKDMRLRGFTMRAIYHSHPHTEAYPSSHDVELALYDNVSYIIVTLKDKDNPSIRSFSIVDGKINEEEVIIT